MKSKFSWNKWVRTAPLLFSGFSAFASVENLTVNSMPSLEKCYLTEPYELVTRIDEKTTSKTWMNKNLIAEKCTEKAVSWASSEKGNSQGLLKISELVRRYDRPEESLRVYQVMFSEPKNSSHCENSTFYSTLIQALSHPEDFPSQTDSDFLRAQEIVKLCWSEKSFRKDIQDEVETDKNYVTENLCRIFRSQKINLPQKCKN
jgi:hypothetical protein